MLIVLTLCLSVACAKEGDTVFAPTVENMEQYDRVILIVLGIKHFLLYLAFVMAFSLAAGWVVNLFG